MRAREREREKEKETERENNRERDIERLLLNARGLSRTHSRNTLQHAATRSNTLQHTATHCNTMLVREVLGGVTRDANEGICVSCSVFSARSLYNKLTQHAATRFNTLQHTATRCNTEISLQHTHALCCSTLQHTATHSARESERQNVCACVCVCAR